MIDLKKKFYQNALTKTREKINKNLINTFTVNESIPIKILDMRNSVVTIMKTNEIMKKKSLFYDPHFESTLA